MGKPLFSHADDQGKGRSGRANPAAANKHTKRKSKSKTGEPLPKIPEVDRILDRQERKGKKKR